MEDIEETESKLLERTHAHELMTNKDGQVTGGTLPALIERLTTPDTPPDGQFVSTFYLTFRLFTTPTNFAQALIDRWDNVEQSPLTSLPVRLRVYNVLKGWMESHWRNDCDGVALKMIHTFAKRMVLPGLYGPANKIFDLVEKVVGTEETLVPRLVSSMGKTNTSSARYVSPDTPNPTPHITTKQLAILKSWKAGLGQPCILDFEPIELARQFTLQQSRRFCTILPEELLGCEWMNKSSSIAKNVRENIKLSTNLTTLVTDSVLGPEDPKKRAVIIKQWIKVGMKCLELKNYDSVLAIVCALDSSIVQRLRKTWEAISTNKKGHFDTLRKLTNVDHNRQALRQALRDEIPPCIPFVGMYLTDLAFTDYGNQSTRELHGPAPRPGHGPATQNLEVINFDKHMKTAKIIGDLQRFQIPYRLAEVPDLADWIADNLDRLAGDAGPEDSSRTQEYYRRSLALEPRDSGSRGATKMVSPVLEQGTFPIAAPMIKGGFDFRAWTQSLGRDRSGADVAAS